MHLIDVFNQTAQRWPDRVFLREGDDARTYGDVHESAQAVARGLKAKGIAPKTRVGILGPNSADLMEGILGTLTAACIWVPINAHSVAQEIVEYLRYLDVQVILYARSMHRVASEVAASLPHIRIFGLDSSDDTPIGRSAWLSDSQHVTLDDVIPRSDDVLSIMSSGGTTGRPKGIALTALNWELGMATVASLYPGNAPVYLAATPVSHAAGGIALMLLPRGPEIVLLPVFEPLAVMVAIQRHRVTHVFLPPTAIYMLLAHPARNEYDFSSIQYLIYAGAPMSTGKIPEAHTLFGPTLIQFYAQMECFGSISCLTRADHTEALADPTKRHRLASAGRANIYARVEIMGEGGRLLGPDEPGEIVVRSNLVCAGYVGNTDDEVIGADGWHHTSDVGYRDRDGFIYIVDRLRDMIISGGFNVYPSEVEQVLWSHPAVKDCAVIGVPDEKWGEAVTAVVEIKSGETVEEAELIAFCRQRLSGIKTPKRVIVTETLPRSPVGKVLRRVVREPFWVDREKKV